MSFFRFELGSVIGVIVRFRFVSVRIINPLRSYDDVASAANIILFIFYLGLKGSTCAFTESILRNYGFQTGLLTSPHLISVRERFRLDGQVSLTLLEFLREIHKLIEAGT
ncbi:hypothetical protein F2Q68_00000162 [Brassica cretica]|uniref:Uncharacterized protein n=1 Tax=Brassica cretica TaxID=69181 RepID=A0A8S9JI31_BRACR|nr:hypothetical protein F2Q68_00000162 [Brassica cretica]